MAGRYNCYGQAGVKDRQSRQQVRVQVQVQIGGAGGLGFKGSKPRKD